MEPSLKMSFKTVMSSVQNPLGGTRAILAAAFCAFLLIACAPIDTRTPDIPPLLGHDTVEVEEFDPLGLSPEMERFVQTQLSGRKNSETRAWRLAIAMLDPWSFDFTYDPQVTLTAEEAFRQRRGNCLTFSNMFVAMARSAGLDAWYREVDILPEWTNVDDTLLVSKHVNAEVHDRLNSYVVDVSRRQVQKGERARRLSDREAVAQFYNNLGANALVGNDLPLAYAYFRKAAETAPAQAYAWSNLGVVLRRNGQTEDAMLAYQTAMRLDPDQAVAVNNLYTIYDEDGQLEAARELQGRVERNRRRNPYYLHYLAEVANEEHRWEDAQDLARRAIRIEPREYRFYYTLARAQFHDGNERVAQINLNRARSLAPPGVADEELELPGED